MPVPLLLATASISSINIMHGAFFFASSNISLTLDAPTPTNISTKSEPDMLKNGTLASPATAFARSVLPVPGAPVNITPLGILAPSDVYLTGSLRKSTISSSSSFSSLRPATSLKVTLLSSPLTIRARLFPKFIILALPPPPPACLVNIIIKNISTTRLRPKGRIDVRRTLCLVTSLSV